MPKAGRYRRGLYLLPTLFTLANLYCGFIAILYASQGRFVLAAKLVIVAGILDGLDGRIARMTGTSSEFGKQFDSLADLISFGVAPAMLSWFWVLSGMQRLGQGLTFLFVVCVAMRLARFNLQPGKDRRHFVGMPSPAAAGTMGAAMLVLGTLPEGNLWVAGWAIFHSTVALLMVSRFRYRSFKDFDLRTRRSIGQAIPLALALWGLIFWAPLLLMVAIGYMLSAPILSIGSRLMHIGTSSNEMGESGSPRS